MAEGDHVKEKNKFVQLKAKFEEMVEEKETINNKLRNQNNTLEAMVNPNKGGLLRGIFGRGGGA